jgi:hypothetical protein
MNHIEKKLTENRKKVMLSELHDVLIQGNLTLDQRLLLAKMVKSIAVDQLVKVPVVVFSNYYYLNMDEKEELDKF